MAEKSKWLAIIMLVLFSGACSLEGNLGGDTTYIVSFDKNGGTGGSPPSQNVKSSSSVRLPSGSGLSKDDFTFGGWNTDSYGSGKNYSADSFYTPTGNVTLYAKWIPATAPTYTITFNGNGANGTPPAPQEAKAGSSVTLPDGSGLTKSGYTFNGWNTDAFGAGIQYGAGSSYSANGDITLYANWVSPVTTYTVLFYENGGKGTPPAGQVVSAGSSITLPSGSGLSKSGFTFGGWNTDASGNGDLYGAGSSFTPYSNIWLYASWNPVGTTTTYTVTYNANGGSGTLPAAQTVQSGSVITLPNGSGLTRSGFTFGGWNTNSSGTGTNYNAGTSYTVTANVTLYAKWDGNNVSNSGAVPGANLAAKFSWLESNAQSGGEYTVEVDSNESIDDGMALSYYGKNNITITLRGVGQARTISRTSDFQMIFFVGSDVTLILDNNIILQGGRSSNGSSLVYIKGGTLVMNAGSGITGNTTRGQGGGVFVDEGTFTMNGGTISCNTASSIGGGVYVQGGTFTMNAGTISGNTTPLSWYGNGGGVYVSGTFIMNGGTVSGNNSDGGGGGVYVSSSGIFTMSGGTISGNTTFSSSGGGVSVYGTFNMSGGEISGNTTSGGGGGVFVGKTTFNMSGGKISGNTAYNGGGVYVAYRETSFIMRGGEISGNTASTVSGGVSVNGYFTKTGGGTIYGYTSGDTNSNVVQDSSGVVQNNSGHAVYVSTTPVKRRETTAGPTVDLDSTKSGAAGGWE